MNYLLFVKERNVSEYFFFTYEKKNGKWTYWISPDDGILKMFSKFHTFWDYIPLFVM